MYILNWLICVVTGAAVLDARLAVRNACGGVGCRYGLTSALTPFLRIRRNGSTRCATSVTGCVRRSRVPLRVNLNPNALLAYS